MDDGEPVVDRSILQAGERVLLVDAKERRYLVTLRTGASFHTHVGIVAHDDLIGTPEGSTVLGSTGRRFLVVRPTLADVVLKMPRGAQVIYPKDLGAILIAADIAPGMRVLEAGVGSGALSMALLRAGAEVVGYELREDFADRARANVAAMLGPGAPLPGRAAGRLRGDRGGGPRPDRARPARAVAGPGPGHRGPAAGRDPLCLPALDQPGGRVARSHGPERLRDGRDPRGAPPDVARRGALGAARPPHGGPHRLPHDRPAAPALRRGALGGGRYRGSRYRPRWTNQASEQASGPRATPPPGHPAGQPDQR